MTICGLFGKKSGSAVIRVKDSKSGALLPGVKCTLNGVAGTPTAGLSYNGTSGSSGNSLGVVNISGITPGQYTGTLSLAGYTTASF